jgi:hypothetical protein
MKRANDDREDAPRVTGEVGSEGGSYADPTLQVATFSGPADPNVGPIDAAAGNFPIETQVAAVGSMTGPEIADPNETGSGIVRYPTEPPSPAGAREHRRFGGHPWRNGLIGAAAGAAVLVGLSRFRRRRERPVADAS